jgi:tRNA_anti-like
MSVLARVRSALAVSALLSAGCVATSHPITADELARRANEAPIAAQSELGGQWIDVQGVVRDTKLTQRESVVATAGGWGTAVAQRRSETLPLVELEPGSISCFFEPRDIKDAADVRPGQTVSLRCRVDSFRQSEYGVEAILSGCRRRSP